MRAHLIPPLLIAALLALGPFILPQFYVTLFTYIAIYSIVALGLVVLTGLGGLTSFGQAAFVGLAAYTTAVFTTQYGLSPWLTLFMALAATAAVALVLGMITLSLAGHYLVLGTLAWGIGFYFLFANLQGLGGFNGIPGLPQVELLGLTLDDRETAYWSIWVVVGLVYLATRNLLNSRMGRAIRSLRAAVMAESFGISTYRLKLFIFCYAALLAGLSGWIYAHYLRFVNPGPFNISWSIEYLFMVVVGGAGQLAGAILGSTVITWLKTELQGWLPQVLGTAGNFEIVVFGILVILLLQNAGGGLMPFLSRFLPKPPPPKAPASAEPLPRRERPTPGQTLLEVKGAVKRFGGLTAVGGVSFEVKAGEILGLIGPNGAGKSTMFNLITGVLPMSEGSVAYMGERIDGRPMRTIVGRGLARTFQHVHLRQNMTVLENTALGAFGRTSAGLFQSAFGLDRGEERRALFEAQKQLERVGLADLADQPAGNLALGPQRVLEIARALAADPVLLLLDEPAAGLRFQEKQQLAALLRALKAEGTTILLVEHDMEFVMNLVDRLIVMDFGELIAEGPPARVRTDKRVIEAYLGTTDEAA